MQYVDKVTKVLRLRSNIDDKCDELDKVAYWNIRYIPGSSIRQTMDADF